jgi:hypothetical protein
MFITKTRKFYYTEANTYRPICLSSILLKKIGKLVDRHNRDGAMRKFPLHLTQHAYQTGKSTETALHNVTMANEH